MSNCLVIADAPRDEDGGFGENEKLNTQVAVWGMEAGQMFIRGESSWSR